MNIKPSARFFVTIGSLAGLLLLGFYLFPYLPFKGGLSKAEWAKQKAFLSQGEKYHDWKDYQTAILQFNAAIQIAPNLPEAHLYKGRSYFQLEKYGPAFNAINRSLRLDPDYAAAKLELGQLYLQNGQLEKARRMAQQLIKKQPYGAQGLLLHAQINLVQQHYDEALGRLKTALDHTPQHIEAGLTLAKIHFLAGNLDQAEQTLLERAARPDAPPKVHLALSSFYRANQQHAKALQVLTDAASRYDSSHVILIGLGLYYQAIDAPDLAEQAYLNAARHHPNNAWVQYLLGEYYTERKNHPAAVRWFTRALAADPHFLLPKKSLSRLYLTDGQLAASDTLVGQILATVPDDIFALYLKGKLLFLNGQYDEAQAVLEKAQANAENYYKGALIAQEQVRPADQQFRFGMPEDLQYLLGISYQQSQRSLETLIAIEQVNTKSPSYKASRLLLAEAYFKTANLERTITLTREILADTPGHLEAAYLLGRALRTSGNNERDREGVDLCLKSLPALIAASPQNLQLYIDLGLALEASARAGTSAATPHPDAPVFTRAEQAYRTVLAQDPKHAHALLLLGHYYAFRDQADSAIAYYTRIPDSTPRHREANKQLAYQYLLDGRLAASARLTERILYEKMNDPEGLYLQGRIHLARREPQAALKALERLATQSAQYAFPERRPEAPFMYYLASAYFLNDDFVQTEKTLQRIPSDQSQNPLVILLKAQNVAGQNNLSQAIALLKTVSKNAPTYLQAAGLRGEYLVRLNQLTAAARLFKTILARDAENFQALYGTSLLYARQDQLEEAMNVLDRLLAAHPNRTEPLALVIQLQLEQGQPDLALQYGHRQLKRAPQNIELHRLVAQLLIDQGATAAALALLKDGLALAPDQVELHYLMAMLHEKNGNIPKAISSYETALRVNPRHLQTSNRLTALHNSFDANSEAAWHQARMAAELSPQDASLQDRLGWISFNKGNLNSAILALEKSVRLAPEEPTYRYHLGMVLYKEKNYKEARRQLEKSLALGLEKTTADTVRLLLNRFSLEQADTLNTVLKKTLSPF